MSNKSRYEISDRCFFALLNLTNKAAEQFVKNLELFMPIFKKHGVSILPYWEHVDDEDDESEPSKLEEPGEGYQ